MRTKGRRAAIYLMSWPSHPSARRARTNHRHDRRPSVEASRGAYPLARYPRGVVRREKHHYRSDLVRLTETGAQWRRRYSRISLRTPNEAYLLATLRVGLAGSDGVDPNIPRT